MTTAIGLPGEAKGERRLEGEAGAARRLEAALLGGDGAGRAGHGRLDRAGLATCRVGDEALAVEVEVDRPDLQGDTVEALRERVAFDAERCGSGVDAEPCPDEHFAEVEGAGEKWHGDCHSEGGALVGAGEVNAAFGVEGIEARPQADGDGADLAACGAAGGFGLGCRANPHPGEHPQQAGRVAQGDRAQFFRFARPRPRDRHRLGAEGAGAGVEGAGGERGLEGRGRPGGRDRDAVDGERADRKPERARHESAGECGGGQSGFAQWLSCTSSRSLLSNRHRKAKVAAGTAPAGGDGGSTGNAPDRIRTCDLRFRRLAFCSVANGIRTPFEEQGQLRRSPDVAIQPMTLRIASWLLSKAWVYTLIIVSTLWPATRARSASSIPAARRWVT